MLSISTALEMTKMVFGSHANDLCCRSHSWEASRLQMSQSEIFKIIHLGCVALSSEYLALRPVCLIK